MSWHYIQVILIGKDFGSRIAYIFSLLHPGRVSGVITLGVPFVPPSRPTVLKHLPEGSYISRWQERGRAETDFSRFDCKTVIRNIYILFSRNEVPIANENQEIMDILDVSTPLPSWFTEEDLSVYASLYEKSGFQTALQVPYRSLHEEFNIANLKVEVPALVIMGGKDYSLKFPGIEDYIKSGRAKVHVPNLETAFLPEGSHFMQEQFPDQQPLKMEKIEHKYVQVNGLKLHLAETGSASSPAVVFLHGFPEIWYSWRHQIVAVAEAGFRAIAPDYRGYGLSDQPPEPEKATWSDFIADISALFDALSISKAFVIGTDAGGILAYLFALQHPEKVSGVITLGVPCLPPGPMNFHENLPEVELNFSFFHFQKPGRAEADFGRFDSKTIVRNIYILFARSEIPIAEENQEIMDMVDSSTPLPPWFTDEDLEAYGSLYEKSTFRTALKVPYRSLSEEFNIKHDKVEAPALFVTGENDYFLKFPGIEEYVRGEQSKMFVPKLETVYVQEEGTHFVHEQFPDQVNKLILNFLKNTSS
ncbi:hypothetical protein BUALT_BualtUnG0056000 [Buddleja alternifolia]|uniref:AB hydrolase-1 domain-containing protein n=1 Tax=Buddleja alternifolia TaxID=168488 RepID=A0AAV6W6R6_9LAMI|nr:hypothetical protein BUALT_BualtUnG0056000 [Buddleja alternifolia]